MKKLLLIAIIIGLAGTTQAQFKKVGRTSMQFVKIGIGARETAMGEASIANLNNVNAMFWNPAGLTKVQGQEAAVHYTKWFADLNLMSAAAAVNLGSFGVVGVNYTILNYGDLEEAFVTSPTGGMDTRTGNMFTGKDMSLGFSYARQFTDKLSIGVSAHYIREDLHKYYSSIWAFDVGSYYETGWKGIRIAMSAQNFSSQARWMYSGDETRQSFEIPLLYRIGASIDLLGGKDLFLGGDWNTHRFTLNMDAIHSNDYSERVHIGGEYVFLDQFALRGGYRFNYDEGNFSVGVGFNTHFSGVNVKLDYSYVNMDYLDSPHRFSLSFGL
ncbi:MAG: PorV/PorQ family protein [Ignavibacteriaceae bacterium]|nr:PorV/PorQ family protein [Ignavibacteriaceae bacterium]